MDEGFRTSTAAVADTLSSRLAEFIIPSGIAIQADGKIVVAGDAELESTKRGIVLRFLHDGTLDETFGGGDAGAPAGTVLFDFGHGTGSAQHVVVQADGKS